MDFFDEKDFFKDKETEEKNDDNNSASVEEVSETSEVVENIEVQEIEVEMKKEENTDAENETGDGEEETFDGINPSKCLKKRRRNIFLKAIAAITALSISFSVVTTLVLGRGWLGNKLWDDNKIDFTIPIVEHPKLEDKYYESDGRYTAQGIAKAVSPSIVTVLCYKKGQAYAPVSQGSGIIMTTDGYIITNAHVIDEASLGIKIVLNDETEYQAEIVGSDVKTDIAVLKVNVGGEKLKPAIFGDSNALELGEDIVTIGSPAGLYNSVTKGVVSGLDRMIRTDEANALMSCVQIDAAINPGNSGGALLNMWGQVVGITSSKLASSEYENIGFAISMDAAKPIIESLIEHGYVPGRTKIGITFYEMSDATAEIYNTVPGLYIHSIDPNCDIANTDLRPDDTITHMNGQKVVSAEDVTEIIKDLKPGDTVTAKVYRPVVAGEPIIFDIEFKLMEDTSSIIPKD